MINDEYELLTLVVLSSVPVQHAYDDDHYDDDHYHGDDDCNPREVNGCRNDF